MPLGAARINTLSRVLAAAGRTAINLTAKGNVEVDTAIKQFGTGSALFSCTAFNNGTTDVIVSDTDSSLTFAGDLTWECWVYIIDNTTNDTYTFLSNRGGFSAANLYVAARQIDNKWQWGNSTMGANITTQTWSYNTWYHVALVRNGSGSGNFALYVDGVQLQTDTDTNTIGSGITNFISIGGIDAVTPNNGLNGHIDEVRISNVARYTTGFTPSASAFTNDDDTVLLVHMDGTDGSTTFEDDVS